MPSQFVPNQRSLLPTATAQLIRDIENNPGQSCQQILDARPEIYGGVFLRAARNRYNYLNKLKESKPGAYWQAFATGIVPNVPNIIENNNSNMADEEFVPDYQSSWGADSPPVGKKKKAVKVKQEPKIEKTNDLFGSPSTSKGVGSFGSPTKSKKKEGGMFSTLQQAIDCADDVFVADFTHPERNNHGLFIQKIPGVKKGTQLIDVVKVIVSSITDLRDFPLYKGMLVCEGRGLFLRIPTVPHFMRNQEGICKILENDTPKNQTIIDHTKTAVNAITLDESRWTRTVLIVFDDNTVCNADLSSDAVPNGDQKVRMMLQEGSHQVTAFNKTATQLFYPGSFYLRAQVEGPADLEIKQEVEDSLTNAFSGMGF